MEVKGWLYMLWVGRNVKDLQGLFSLQPSCPVVYGEHPDVLLERVGCLDYL